jgi:hypothetical protein
MSFNALGLIRRMCVMDAGTSLNIDLMQEIGTGALNIKAQTDNGNATKK